MHKPVFLRFRSKFYLVFLGILNVFAFSFIFGCSNNSNKTDKNKDGTADSIARVKKVNDSLAKAKHLQDSLADVKRIQDSIVREDSIKKAKKIKQNYKPVRPTMKYGVVPTKY